MAHETNHCDVIDCPLCKAADVQSDRQRSWLGWTTWIGDIVKGFRDWTLVNIGVSDDEVWISSVSVQLTLDIPATNPGELPCEVARNLRALADRIDREVYRREGFQAAMRQAS